MCLLGCCANQERIPDTSNYTLIRIVGGARSATCSYMFALVSTDSVASACHVTLISLLCVRNPQMPCLLVLSGLFFNGGGMAMRPWLETVLKVVVMGATMCSGIIVAKYDVPIGDEGHEGGRGTRPSQQELDRAA